eukprot:3932755-Rhodomonas_salina.2
MMIHALCGTGLACAVTLSRTPLAHRFAHPLHTISHTPCTRLRTPLAHGFAHPLPTASHTPCTRFRWKFHGGYRTVLCETARAGQYRQSTELGYGGIRRLVLRSDISVLAQILQYQYSENERGQSVPGEGY